MRLFTRMATGALMSVGLVSFWDGSNGSASAAPCPQGAVASLQIDVRGDDPMGAVTLPPDHHCTVRMTNGLSVPDPSCTPGAINPSLTLEVLTSPEFRTTCVRNKATTEAKKHATYGWYEIPPPDNNNGTTQTCELDHLVSLELGGADTLDNIWPECGPDDVALSERFFKEKDIVENYLAAQVKAGKMKLADAQRGIASDWTQFLDDAKRECPGGNCP